MKETILELLNYYYKTRGIGHTSLVRRAISSDEYALALFADRRIANASGIPKEAIRDLRNITEMREKRGPLAIDNSAMIFILEGALDEINSRERKIAKLKERLEEIYTISSDRTL